MEQTTPQEPQATQLVPAHVERMMAEAYELNERLTKLNTFLDKFKATKVLPEGMAIGDVDLMVNQQASMRSYLNTLMKRIEKAGVTTEQVMAYGDDLKARSGELMNKTFGDPANDGQEASNTEGGQPLWSRIKDALGNTGDLGLRVRMENLAAELEQHNI